MENSAALIASDTPPARVNLLGMPRAGMEELTITGVASGVDGREASSSFRLRAVVARGD